MRLGSFDLARYKESSGICCDLCDDDTEALVNLFIFKYTFDLCPKCYNEIRNEFITHELKIDKNKEE